MKHGIVSYNLDNGTANYRPAEGKPAFKIVLVSGKNDTAESWFKIGGADVMADKLIASKKLPPFSIVVDCHKNAYALKADDYPSWPERRHALESLLDSLILQAAVKGETSVNLPLFQTKYTADPSPLVVGDTLFLYTSHDASPEDILDANERLAALVYH